ncbi:MAG: 23S rRNA (adenine(2503)-C(2))-methyltransferase RlmN [Victivallaceae bacterium]|nr:23S rRNA (adenine(2503)-C(2))-methyltransferase RlmN [Victivallaceae bacterium]
MENKKAFLAGTSRSTLRDWAVKRGFPAFRGTQIADWVYNKYVLYPHDMSNLPLTVREAVALDFSAPGSQLAESVRSKDGTEKLLIGLRDGETIEMALIPGGSGDRLTFCLSTQVGCQVRCRFCASGRDGLVRNLLTGEILEEFIIGCQEAGARPDNLVFMGIGEGMLNLAELIPALETLTSPDGFGMSPRRITVSTSGYVPGMKEFAKLEREYNLAISLHAPDDEVRSKIIPDPLRYPVAEILAAADLYREKAGRMVTLEYTLLDGVNDRPEDARKLAELAICHHAKINLIPFNPTGSDFDRPPRRVIEAFADKLERAGAHVTVRVERGGDSDAACGQLRLRHNKTADSE